MKTTNKNMLIKKFLENKLTEPDVAKIRHLIQKDAFFRNSILGYIENNAHPDDLNSLDEKWAPKPKQRKIKQFAIGITIAASLALFFFLHFYQPQRTHYHPVSEPKFFALETFRLPTVIISPDCDTIHESDNVNLENRMDVYAFDDVLPFEKQSERQEIALMYRKPKLSIESIHSHSEINENWVANSNHLYGFIDTYKIVDYRIDSRKNKTHFTIPQRHNATISNNSAVHNTEIRYMNFLAKALNKFNTENYQAALEDFRTILSQYPNDMNALFYAGLCHYHTSNQEKCIAVMERVINAKINTFDQDANWYQAMSYKSIHDIEQTRMLLTKISQSDNYYGAMAHDELKKLNEIK